MPKMLNKRLTGGGRRAASRIGTTAGSPQPLDRPRAGGSGFGTPGQRFSRAGGGMTLPKTGMKAPKMGRRPKRGGGMRTSVGKRGRKRR